MNAPSPTALLRVALDQPFRQQYEAENLRPFRNNVADDLAPFGLRVHPSIKRNPSDPRNDKKNAKRMVAQSLPDVNPEILRWTSTLIRALFVQVLGREYHDHDAGPVGDGVAKE